MDLEPLDPAYVERRLSEPPFTTIEGVYNVRDLSYSRSASSPSPVKPGLFYRSAELSSITQKGKEQFTQLGIRKIFDMRSDPELNKFAAPLPNIDGAEVVRAAVFKNTDYSPEVMAKRYKLYAEAKTEAFMQLYSQILDAGGPAFGIILRHIRDNPTEPCIFHCTAGKDRTGIIAAIILRLAGVDDESIAEDFALTRVGREPAREKVMKRLMQEPMFANDREAMAKMFTCEPETMIAFLQLLDTKYGGAEGYLRAYCGFSDSEISTLRENIMT